MSNPLSSMRPLESLLGKKEKYWVFEQPLSKSQTVARWTSYGSDSSEAAAELQRLFDENKSGEYEAKLKAYEDQGLNFRLTKGKVYEIKDEGQKVACRIKFQVKGGCMTWYIEAPMDETKQKFRDKIYLSAALGHLTVQNHCEAYWRGTNSLHVKKMHTSEKESGKNHNHYRVKEDRYVEPTDVREHLMGFVKAQMELGHTVEDSDGFVEGRFLSDDEAQKIANDFDIYWAKFTHQGPATTITLHGETIELPAKEKSDFEIYKSWQENRMTEEDKAEWEAHKHEEQPCKTIVPSMTIAEKKAAIAKAMRGIGSELAQTRQVEGSRFSEHKAVVSMADRKILDITAHVTR